MDELLNCFFILFEFPGKKGYFLIKKEGKKIKEIRSFFFFQR